MKILITGGAGYIGSALTLLLQEIDEIKKIIIYDNLKRKNYSLFTCNKKLSKVEFINADILDRKKLTNAVQQVDKVIHLAAKVLTPFSDSEIHAFDQVNNWGTAHLVDILDNNPKDIIFLSSASVYGVSSNNHLLNENSSIKPSSFYGTSKLDAEKHIKRLENSCNYYILRCANVYGYSPAWRMDAVVNKFMFEANFKKQLIIYGDGTQHRPFIYLKTLLKVIQKILIDGATKKGTYNLVEHNLSINDVKDVVQKIIPGTEIIYINKENKLKGLQLEPSHKLFEKLDIKETNFEKELTQFKDRFSF
ncbi:MAG: SDR family oxidoreductase [Aureibaculum sp.]|nr:SDR family oxidoreductase [Aureibaculum sp.]